MTRHALDSAVTEAELALTPEARHECGWSTAPIMPTRHEQVCYLMELRREAARAESDRRMMIFYSEGIAAFRASKRPS